MHYCSNESGGIALIQRGKKVEAVRRAAEREAEGNGTLAVIATDDAGTILYWNRQAEELYGWPSAEALGRNIVDVTPTMTTQAEAESIMRKLLAGSPWKGQFMVRHRDGTPMVVHVRDIPVVEDGAVVGIVGVSSAQ